MRDNYKNLTFNATIDQVLDWITDVNRRRVFDVQDYNNQVELNPSIFSVPSSSADLNGNEKAGDIATSDTHLYVVVDTGSGLEWRRVAISTF